MLMTHFSFPNQPRLHSLRRITWKRFENIFWVWFPLFQFWRWERSTVKEGGAAKGMATSGKEKRRRRTCFAHTPLLSALGCSTGGQSTGFHCHLYLFPVTGLPSRRSSSLKSISQLTGSSEMKPWMQPTLQSSTKSRWVFKLSSKTLLSKNRKN